MSCIGSGILHTVRFRINGLWPLLGMYVQRDVSALCGETVKRHMPMDSLYPLCILDKESDTYRRQKATRVKNASPGNLTW